MLKTYKIRAISDFVKPVKFKGFLNKVSNPGNNWLQLTNYQISFKNGECN
jgi:hypothetical protein